MPGARPRADTAELTARFGRFADSRLAADGAASPMSTNLVFLAILMFAVTYPSRALGLLTPGLDRLPEDRLRLSPARRAGGARGARGGRRHGHA